MSATPRDLTGADASPCPPRPRHSSVGRWAVIAGVVLAVALFYALGLYDYVSWDYVRSHLDGLRAQVQQDLLLAVLVFFLVYVAVTALSLPAAAVLSLLAGALFGRWVGTAVVSAAATLGATLAFLGSRYLFRDFIQRRWGDKLRAVNAGVARDGAYYLLALRLVPVFPFFLINLGMGLTPLRVGTFVGVSFVGMLPGTFVYVNAGSTAQETIRSPQDVLSWQMGLALALLALLPLALKLLVRWKQRR